MAEGNEDIPSDETPDAYDDENPSFEEVGEQMDLSDHVEPADPLEEACLLYTSPSPRDRSISRMPSSA